jgi:Polyketide cyclase / dehydrase and lipid transport
VEGEAEMNSGAPDTMLSAGPLHDSHMRMRIMPTETRKLSVQINRPAAEVYDFLSRPENFSKWASGLGTSLRRAGPDWIVETAEGLATVRFSEHNSYGVLDHSVRLPRGGSVYVPLRVVPHGEGCELVLTLYRQPQMSDEKFATDAEWVMRDLQSAKRILEG